MVELRVTVSDADSYPVPVTNLCETRGYTRTRDVH